jgi:hypothetical protein
LMPRSQPISGAIARADEGSERPLRYVKCTAASLIYICMGDTEVCPFNQTTAWNAALPGHPAFSAIRKRARQTSILNRASTQRRIRLGRQQQQQMECSSKLRPSTIEATASRRMTRYPEAQHRSRGCRALLHRCTSSQCRRHTSTATHPHRGPQQNTAAQAH